MAFVQWLDKNRKASESALAEFKKKLDKDPAHAFEWSQDYMRAAARLRVYSIVQNQLDREASLDEIRTHAADIALKGAQFPQMSTLQTSNLMRTFDSQAWAEIAEAIKWRE